MILDERKYKFRTYLSDNIYRDQNNFLVCTDCVMGRTGIQKYGAKELGLKDKSGIIEVHRHEKDVFDEQSLASLQARPFTLGHVYEKDGVTIDNYKKYSKGSCYNIRREDNNIVGDIIITDKDVANLVEKGKLRELSLGYSQKLAYDSEKDEYSFIDIVYNHLALVEKGRAGNAMIFDGIMEEEMENENIVTEETTVVEETTINDESNVTEEVKVEEQVQTVEETKEVVEETKTVEVVVETVKEVNDEKKKDDEKGEIKMDNVIVKDTAYFLEKQKEIASIEDKNVRSMMAKALEKEMKEFLCEEHNEATIVVETVVTDSEDDVYDSHEDKMQEFFDTFDPNLYSSKEEYEKVVKANCICDSMERIARKARISNKK